MKVLITGACGLIGRELIEELKEAHELRLLDQTPPEEATVWAGSGKRALKPFETDLPFIQAQITDPEAVRAAAEGMDAVIHLAGEPRGLAEIGVDTFHTNAHGTFVVIDGARLAGVRRFMCASSINAFGSFYWRLSGVAPEYEKMPLDEDYPPVPEDPYSLSKMVNEETCAAFNRAYGMTTAAFRFAGVWPSERYEKVLEGGLEPTTAWSDDLYQWVHVADVVRGLRLALESKNLPGFGVYVLGAGDTRCPEDTIEILEKFRPDLARNLEVALEGRSPLLSIHRARKTFGYNPRYRLGP